MNFIRKKQKVLNMVAEFKQSFRTDATHGKEMNK